MANTWKKDRARFLRESGPRPRTAADVARLLKLCIQAHASVSHLQADQIVETMFDALKHHRISLRLDPEGTPPDYSPPAGTPIYKDGRILRLVAGDRRR